MSSWPEAEITLCCRSRVRAVSHHNASGDSDCAWWHHWGKAGVLLPWGAGTEQEQAQFCTFCSLSNLWPSVGRHWKRRRRCTVGHWGLLPPAQRMGILVTTCLFSTGGSLLFCWSQTWLVEAVCCSSTDAPGCLAAQEWVSLFQPVVFLTPVLQLKEKGGLEVTLQLLLNRLLCAAGGWATSCTEIKSKGVQI